jgi:F0F1-type ATP synthase assembly protein I
MNINIKVKLWMRYVACVLIGAGVGVYGAYAGVTMPQGILIVIVLAAIVALLIPDSISRGDQ